MAEAMHTDLVIPSQRPTMDNARMIAECIISHMEDERDWAIQALLGKATWTYEPDLDIHIPCCTVTYDPKDPARHAVAWEDIRPGMRVCGNGPLVKDQILSGNCGEH